jgi:hypothetical protein
LFQKEKIKCGWREGGKAGVSNGEILIKMGRGSV